MMGFLFLVNPALAIDLQSAKNQKLVGETPSGYLAAVKSPSSEVQQLIKDINGKRKSKYQSIARKNGTTLDTVQQLAGKKAIDKSKKKGHCVKLGGEWSC